MSHEPGPERDRVIAIDPGLSKCGMAVVCRNGEILYRAVVTTPNAANQVQKLVDTYFPAGREPVVVIGDGTGSNMASAMIRSSYPSLKAVVTDEAHSSLEARARFLQDHKPRGWQRLLPASLRTPNRAYDDYVAVILAERYWKKQS